MTTEKKQLGIWSLTALVAGNMIGSGIFLLPANLAQIGSITLLSWLLTSTGAMLLAIVFMYMSRWVPKIGGPYAYAKAGFGRFIGFQMAYCYWIAVWVGNAAIAVAAVSYLSVFFPFLHMAILSCLAAIGLVWLFTWINISGVENAGITQLVTMILKLVPIALIVLFGWRFVHPQYLHDSVNVTSPHVNNLIAFSHGATLTLWAFVGIESATVPTTSVAAPERTIPLATLFGTLIAIIVYVSSSFIIMGMIPANQLAHSFSPFADAAQLIFGNWGRWLVAAGAIIACVGALNGWTLLQGQIPLAAAKDGLFPKLFERTTKNGTPRMALIVSAFLISLLLLLTLTPNLVEQFRVTILIATLSSLIPYFFTAFAAIILMRKRKLIQHYRPVFWIALLAAIYAIWAIYGSGELMIVYGSVLLISSVVFYSCLDITARPSAVKKLNEQAANVHD